MQYEYYGSNISVYIEGIALESFSRAEPFLSLSKSKSCKEHAGIHYFLSDDIKQDAATTYAHRKCIIELLNQRNKTSPESSATW